MIDHLIHQNHQIGPIPIVFQAVLNRHLRHRHLLRNQKRRNKLRFGYSISIKSYLIKDNNCLYRRVRYAN
ncbi:MAG: hypothetical protein CEE38_18805 [Planctomycetes bacterium B3_Pla]|nr:MAG: hypothetical protein CEE38_18805 [Planctomycetes bacterium B3_Pla]